MYIYIYISEAIYIHIYIYNIDIHLQRRKNVTGSFFCLMRVSLVSPHTSVWFPSISYIQWFLMTQPNYGYKHIPYRIIYTWLHLTLPNYCYRCLHHAPLRKQRVRILGCLPCHRHTRALSLSIRGPANMMFLKAESRFFFFMRNFLNSVLSFVPEICQPQKKKDAKQEVAKPAGSIFKS